LDNPNLTPWTFIALPVSIIVTYAALVAAYGGSCLIIILLNRI
jgi:hypothetical protein